MTDFLRIVTVWEEVQMIRRLLDKLFPPDEEVFEVQQSDPLDDMAVTQMSKGFGELVCSPLTGQVYNVLWVRDSDDEVLHGVRWYI